MGGNAIINPSDGAQAGLWNTVFAANNAIVKNGTGTVTLNGVNTYNGVTTVNAGALVAGNAAALGDGTVGTTVNAGGTLAITGGITVAEPLTLSAAGTGGTLEGRSGLNTFSGTIAVQATGDFGNINIREAGAPAISEITITTASINLQTAGLTVSGSGNTIINSVISGAGANVIATGALDGFFFGGTNSVQGYIYIYIVVDNYLPP